MTLAGITWEIFEELILKPSCTLHITVTRNV